MGWTGWLHFLGALALAGCAQQTGGTAAAHRSEAAAAPSLYVMRHLQKADGPDPALSDEGRRNAELLPRLLAADPPSAIYVSTTRRARETAAPLAAVLGLVPKDYDPADTPALIAAVAREPGTVLIVGHSNTVADIVGRLGGTAPAPLAESDFGDVWHLEGSERRTTRLRLGQ